MPDDELMCSFEQGLRSSIRQEVRLWQPQTLDAMVNMVEDVKYLDKLDVEYLEELDVEEQRGSTSNRSFPIPGQDMTPMDLKAVSGSRIQCYYCRKFGPKQHECPQRAYNQAKDKLVKNQCGN